ncbi:MAG: cytochrome c peroxidase [bacterium]
MNENLKRTAGLLLALFSLAACSKAPSPTGDITALSPGAQGKPAKDYPFVKVPLGLSDDLNVPAENPLTLDKIELGKRLYFDKRLSVDNTVSCATCHLPASGWADPKPVSEGFHGQKGVRNAPTVVNATYLKLQFWDGRAKTLEDQALGPIANPVEMGNTHEGMVKSVSSINDYQPLFQKAFGGPPTKERVAQAIASFERTLLSGNSKYDRFTNGDKSALNDSEARGKDLFFGKAKCVVCHNGPIFSDSAFHNLGVGMNQPKPDVGRYQETKEAKDMGAFKTPMLRDLQKSAPYMHDGSEKTLEEVVEFYDKGGNPNPHLDPLMTPLNLTPDEKKDLVAFLKALEGNPYPQVKEPEPSK